MKEWRTPLGALVAAALAIVAAVGGTVRWESLTFMPESDLG